MPQLQRLLCESLCQLLHHRHSRQQPQQQQQQQRHQVSISSKRRLHSMQRLHA
jgi:hypothetical protein